MKQAMTLLLGVMALFALGCETLGYGQVQTLSYGLITFMALMISLTFLWLYLVRATPLALGMALSWAGSALTIGWWWLMRLLDQPAWGQENAILLMFLAFLVSGAVLHFAVIQSSFGLRGGAFLLPVGAAFWLAVVVMLAA